MAKEIWLALGLVLVIEGLLPALNPGGYRRMVQLLNERNDGTLRLIGLGMLIVGALLIYIT